MSLKDVNKLLKLDPTNTQLLEQKQKLLQEAIKETKSKLDVLKEADKQAKEQLESGTLGQEKYDALQREIAETEQKLKDFRNTVGSGSAKLSEISAYTDKFGTKASEAGKKLAPLSVGAAGVGFAVGKMAVDFESAFAGVEKTVNGTPKQLNEIRQGILDLSKETTSSASEIAAVAEAAGQLGIKTPDILEFTKTMVMLGDSTNLGAEEAASALAKFANITQMSADNYDNLGSVIVDLGNKFATTESDIVDMATKLASTGELAGFSEPQIMAIATAMSSVGIEAEAGGTAFSKLTKQIQVAVETGSGELEQFASVAGMTTSEFQKSFEKDAVGAIGKFISGLNDTERNGKSAIVTLDEMGLTEARMSNTILALANSGDLLTDSIDTANGAWEENTALNDEASKRYETTAAKMEQARNAAVEAGISLGNGLLPYIKQLADLIKNIADKFTNLSPTAQKIILLIIGLTAIITPLLITIGKLSTGISAITGVLSKASVAGKAISTVLGGLKTAFSGLFGIIAANPVVAVAVAIIGAIVLLYTKCEWFRDGVNFIITNIIDFFKNLGNYIKNIFDSIGQIISNVASSIGNAFQNLLGSIRNIWNTIKNFILNTAKNIKDATVDAFKNMVTGIASKVSEIRGVIQRGFQSAINFITSLPSKALNWGRDFVDGLVDGIKGSIGKVGSAAKSVAGKITSFLHFSRPDEGPLRYYEKWMPDFMQGLATGIDSNIYKVTASLKRLANGMADLSTDMNVFATANGANIEIPATDVLVQIGNRYFDDYIVKTSQKGIGKTQKGTMKARGK